MNVHFKCGGWQEMRHEIVVPNNGSVVLDPATCKSASNGSSVRTCGPSRLCAMIAMENNAGCPTATMMDVRWVKEFLRSALSAVTTTATPLCHANAVVGKK